MPDHPRRPGVYIEEQSADPPGIVAADSAVTAFVGATPKGPIGHPTPVTSLAEYDLTFDGASGPGPMSQALRGFFGNGGTRAIVLRVSMDGPALDDLLVGDPARGTGLHALEAVADFDLLVIPPPDPATDLALGTWKAAAAYCRKRGAILLVDPPAAWNTDPAAAQTGVETYRRAVGPDATNAAMLFPRLLVADATAPGGTIAVAPSGAVAGVIARTDATRGVWAAPAGTRAAIHGVLGLEIALGGTDLAALNPLGLNCLRTLPSVGPAIWGARTLAGSDALRSEWKYLPVRRLALFLEKSLRRGLEWTVFEPNDERLWAAIRRGVTRFLQTLFMEGAFPGSAPDKAYFVRCDASTTTKADIARGITTLEVGFAPLKPAEFLVITLQLRARSA